MVATLAVWVTACAAPAEPITAPTPATTTQPPSTSASAELTYVLSGHAIPHLSCWDDPILSEGTEVRIRDEADELIAVGNVGERDRDTLRWAVEIEVPAARFYVVEIGVGDTEDQTFTPEELAEGDLLLVANSADCD